MPARSSGSPAWSARVAAKSARSSPACDAVAGIVYLTEDRKASGIFSHLTIADNLFLGHLGGQVPLPLLALTGQRRRLAETLIEKFKIRALHPLRAKLVELSGGNQQKVVLAKGLSEKPLVAILDEPTRG